MTKVLYITFIDLDGDIRSGSSMRPVKMLEAFQELGVELQVLSGMNNQRKLRRRNIAELRTRLNTWRPDLCYIEPPSGPMFCREDLKLIKDLHKAGIPIALFYRDAYWKYPEYYLDKDSPLADRLKHRIVRSMQKKQWRFFEKNIDVLYFPSKTMAEIFDHEDILPPGSFYPNYREKTKVGRPMQFIFVGGAHKNHGTFLTIDAFRLANQDSIIAKLFYICPKEQWESLRLDKNVDTNWLEVIHAAGDEELRPYYERADVAILAAPRTFYRDFAVPTKIYEYFSYGKPILVTNCTETARIIEETYAGWVTNDDVLSVTSEIKSICNNTEELLYRKKMAQKARSENLWVRRAETVINDLLVGRESKLKE